MNRKIFPALFSAVTAAVVAAALWAGGSAGAAPAVASTESFQLMATAASPSTLSVIATGAFTAGGTAQVKQHAYTLTFSAGTVKLVEYAGGGSQSLNSKTCLLTGTLKGDYKITGGTGQYAGISGTGKLTGNITGIVTRSGGKCRASGPFIAFQETIRGSGPVTT